MNTNVRLAHWKLAVFLACAASPSFAQSYRVDFGANNVFPLPLPSYDFGCPFCPQGQWNAVDAGNPAAVSLIDINSVSAGVTLTHAGGAGNFQFDSPSTLSGSGNERLFDDLQNVGPQGSSTTWTMHGLPNGLYFIQICGWAPDDPTQLTEITVPGGMRGAQIVGGMVGQPFPGGSGGPTASFDYVNVSNGELAFSALAVQGFGSVNGFLLDPLSCGSTYAFCSAKVNSLGCMPNWAPSGASSATATSGFNLKVTNVLNQKPGLLMYGFDGRQAIPFQGGTLCVMSPIHRSPGVSSNGVPLPVNNCSGAFAIDMNSFAAGLLGGNPAPLLRVPGTLVTCQWWGRDPGFVAPDATALSRGLQYFVCP